ncbi:protein GRAVITROPIC IN THE LIGHT 1-like isoform X3 [Papaver somniferum]|uniref:protein GRAVITROPIC IN THE LIGHT 1-like isoform X3 n=1 Tax=Papaver somniferum TaxID=3469 RepID=UPI000E6F602D|nr:protein GRAVITROPIC IN THE LIGHT 1-like isoform X3 [Papaver somniferum]
MSMNRVSSISDLIHRVATSCLQNPLTDNHHQSLGSSQNSSSNPTEYEEIESENEEDEENGVLGNEKQKKKKNESREIEELMSDVFESISVMKKAYVKLQQAHSPWDQEKMSVADIAVVSELRKLGMLKERFRRRNRSNGGGEQESGSGRRGFVPLREVVAPYEAAMDELKKQVKTKDIEIENLEQKLQNAITTINTTNGSNGKRGKFHSRRRVSNCSLGHVAGVAPGAEQFESTTSQMKEASKSFTALLLSLMRSAGWDIDAAVRSIESASPTTTTTINKGDNMASTNSGKIVLLNFKI